MSANIYIPAARTIIRICIVDPVSYHVNLCAAAVVGGVLLSGDEEVVREHQSPTSPDTREQTALQLSPTGFPTVSSPILRVFDIKRTALYFVTTASMSFFVSRST